jgi:hypothetical protein
MNKDIKKIPSSVLQNIFDVYLSQKNINSELECRFWLYNNDKETSWSKRKITKLDMDRVVGQLKGSGFVLDENKDSYYLRITPMEKQKQGTRDEYKSLPIRLDVQGLDAIQRYCKTNSIPQEQTSSETWRFTEKKNPDGLDTSMALFNDLNYSVSLKTEKHFLLHVQETKQIIENWNQTKKLFRMIKRCRFKHKENPGVFVDISIIKTNRKNMGLPIPANTLHDAGVMSSPETFEIELEGNNEILFECKNITEIMNQFRPVIYRVLSALQSTIYPVPHTEQDLVLKEYIHLIYNLKPKGSLENRRPGIYSVDFLGPSSMTLQLDNVVPENKNNILENYVVTDKADGERKLFFICPIDKKAKIARIYLIDINMNVVFTGKTTSDEKYFYTLIDGEHVIRHDNQGNIVNLFLAFDIYFGWSIEDKTVKSFCHFPFYISKKDTQDKNEGTQDLSKIYNYRYDLLKEFVKNWNVPDKKPQIDKSSSLMLMVKDFIHNKSIFEASSKVLKSVEFSNYPTDGLIFTPCDLPVPIHPGTHNFKVSWEKSFKWKPPNFNTIDFFVAVRKNKENNDFIKTEFHSGTNLTQAEGDTNYKIVELHCGYDKQKHRFINPFATLLKEFNKDNVKFKTSNDDDESESSQGYFHQKFQPTCPFLAHAYLAYIPLSRNDLNEWVMKTTSGEIFTEGTIVEFSYNVTDNFSSQPRRWKPLRVRYDKTANLLAGQKEFGNAFHVADSIWHSLHFPLTQQIIETGQNINVENTEIYYEKSNGFITDRLRKFHNYVKRVLIQAVSVNGNKTIIDFAVGKAGDLNKWIESKYEFVFGIDYSRDNIMNKENGACVRYIKEKDKKQNSTLRGIFIVGDSSKNIRDGDAFQADGEFKLVSNAILGGAPINELGKYNGYGRDGFAVSSCQFAIHYFFKNKQTFHNFLRNVCENTKLEGYFIGTTYDGETVFKELQKYSYNEGIVLSTNEKIYFKLLKQYNQTGFPADDSSLGYAINVFQESIGQNLVEYLVHFTFFERTMNDYGFKLVDVKKNNIALPNGAGLFHQLYRNYSGHPMNEGEKTISMMNRYFVFQKQFDVNAATINVFNEKPQQTQNQIKPKFRKIRAGFIIEKN